MNNFYRVTYPIRQPMTCTSIIGYRIYIIIRQLKVRQKFSQKFAVINCIYTGIIHQFNNVSLKVTAVYTNEAVRQELPCSLQKDQRAKS